LPPGTLPPPAITTHGTVNSTAGQLPPGTLPPPGVTQPGASGMSNDVSSNPNTGSPSITTSTSTAHGAAASGK
jgi:hypothetical protein